MREVVNRFTDKVVKARRPIDEDANPRATIDTTSHPGTTCSYKVFDPSVDETLSANEASSETVISVTNAGFFTVGKTVEITLDSNLLHITTVDAVDAVAGTITIADQLTDTAALGNRVRISYGAAVDMPQYGTADFNEEEWGFRENLPDDHAVHLDPRSKTGFEVNIEITLLAGPGLTKRERVCIEIKEKCNDA